ncbi:hypothetical protein Goklo_017638 [Gossypium klotzschianum]|uniref:Myb/SANT-like domain-containing protein n=1 Tax=Gossypium klotzschianum TaxID=34286 RepID=A0A7J8UI81_9ROSI|nr:hypothetical protein [Gossypium klotzschianum]
MSGFSQPSVSSQNSRGTKRKKVPEEDVALVACMVDLYNVGTFNANTGFKELEKMTLKGDWSIVYDMLSGKNNSGLGWDEHSHKEAGQFKHRSFPYYDQLTIIYAKDQATRRDAQTAADIIEETDIEDVATTDTHEEKNDFHGCEADIFLDDMDLLAITT